MHNAPDSNCMTDEWPSHLHFAMKLHSSERKCSLCTTFSYQSSSFENRDAGIQSAGNPDRQIKGQIA